MKIKVKDIEPNPYRNLKKYPLDGKKIADLIISIKRNGYWGGILVRKHPTKPGKYQLAFGHHRWTALKKLGYEWADDTIVHELSIDDMHHRMFDENNETWGVRPACILENVESARNRLNDILAEYETLNHVGENTNMKDLFASNSQFRNCKENGVGRTIILKYLGGLYNENQVKQALYMLKQAEASDSEISLDAIKRLPTLSHAEQFRKATREHRIPKEKQEKIAKEVVKEGVGRRGVAAIVAKHSSVPPIVPAKRQSPKRKPLPNIIEFVNTCETDTDSLNRRLKALHPELEGLVKKGRLMSRLVSALRELGKTASAIVEEYDKQKKRKDSLICQRQ